MVSRLQRSECRMKWIQVHEHTVQETHTSSTPSKHRNKHFNSSIALIICLSCTGDTILCQDYSTVSICKYYKNEKKMIHTQYFLISLNSWMGRRVSLNFSMYTWSNHPVEGQRGHPGPQDLCWGVESVPIDWPHLCHLLVHAGSCAGAEGTETLTSCPSACFAAQLLPEEAEEVQIVTTDTLRPKAFRSVIPPSWWIRRPSHFGVFYCTKRSIYLSFICTRSRLCYLDVQINAGLLVLCVVLGLFLLSINVKCIAWDFSEVSHHIYCKLL